MLDKMPDVSGEIKEVKYLLREIYRKQTMLDKMPDVSGQIIDVQYFLREAYTGLLLQLSKDWVSYEIEFKGEKYVFEPPMTLEEKEKQYIAKRLFIRELLKDAMCLAVEDSMCNRPDIDGFDYRNPFHKLNFLRSLDVDKEDYESPIVPESYKELKEEAAKEKKSISLDLDSYQVVQQTEWEDDNVL